MNHLCKVIALAGSIVLISNFSFAHPPSGIEMEYLTETSTLNISMKHTTHDPREDYIRKLVVSKNGEELQTLRYRIQQNTMQFEAELSLAAEDGDIIGIKAFSAEGGSASASLTVEASKEEKEEEMAEEPEEEEFSRDQIQAEAKKKSVG